MEHETDDRPDSVGIILLLAAQGLCWFGIGLLVGRFVLGGA